MDFIVFSCKLPAKQEALRIFKINMSTMKKSTIITAFLTIVFSSANTIAQPSCSSLNITHKADIVSNCSQMMMTMIHDQNDHPYLYVANKEAGLKVYDISVITAPSLVATVATTLFDMLDVMSVSQYGNYLYLAIGNSFVNPAGGGMAIVDVTTPAAPVVTDYYIAPDANSSGGIVRVEGNLAYLGAMQSGLIILDVADKSDIQFVSQFIPAIDYPPVPNPNAGHYNARGMEVRNGIVYLCYDAGGIRIINCTNKLAPVETGHWCNPAMYLPFDHPKAYNNIVLDDTLAYVAVDYAGMEVLNISDTGNIQMTGWWNPYNAPNTNWFGCNIHANEIHFEKNCRRVFLSTGKSDMHVIDVSNPASPDSCNAYGGTGNETGTWGLGVWKDQIYLSYICAAVPFSSLLTQVTLLTYDTCMATTGVTAPNTNTSVIFSPNPFSTQTVLQSDKTLINATLTVNNIFGQMVTQIENIDGPSVVFPRGTLASGLYVARLTQENKTIATQKLIITE